MVISGGLVGVMLFLVYLAKFDFSHRSPDDEVSGDSIAPSQGYGE